MTQKRPFDDEVVDEAFSKHCRHDGAAEMIPYNDWKAADCTKDSDSGEISIRKGKFELHDHHVDGNCPKIHREDVEEPENDASRSASLSHWATGSTSDEDNTPEEMSHLPFFPGYFSFDRPVRSPINSNDAYCCLFDYPPRKRVPVGPEYQAEIPAWGTQTIQDTSDRNSVGTDDLKLDGVCILSNSVTRPFSYCGKKVGDGRADCRCPDQVSIRCVRQHIVEARENLRRMLGPDVFMELGFYDMGEVVAENWSLEEEQLFHEVVYCNPVSLGKNFWNALSAVFPSRTRMEIVSYFFNVFMLRKRAAQNRSDQMNIDSDNDEWQGSDDGGDGGLSEEDDDSGIESPVRHDSLDTCQNGLYVHEYEEDDGNTSDKARGTHENSRRGHVKKSNSDFSFEFLRSDNDVDENDMQDESCTSSDSGVSAQGAQMKTDGCHEWHEYLLDSSYSKAWDCYNINCSKSSVDFLPTCSMIEEIFGDRDSDPRGKRR